MLEHTKLWLGKSLLATGLALVTGGAIATGWTLEANAFSIDGDGNITIYENAADNPEGKTDVGRYFDIDVNGLVDFEDGNGPTELSGLSSTFRMLVGDFTTIGTGADAYTQITLNVEGYVGVQPYNTDPLYPAQDSDLFEDYRVSVFGMQVDPQLSGAGVTGVFDTAVMGDDINANGGIDIDVCFKDGGGPNCDGGGGGGIAKGTMEAFDITLTFGSVIDSFTVSNFGVRYQDIESDYYGISGGSGTGEGEGIPEPMTILGTAAALGFGKLFKQKYDQQKQNQA